LRRIQRSPRRPSVKPSFPGRPGSAVVADGMRHRAAPFF
jgi:hypothetical protein